MIKHSFILCLLAISFNSFTQGINFSDKSWNEVLAQAKAEDKYVFVDAYTTWCGPCKKMDAEIFPEASVGKFFNKHFISIKLDMEKEGDGKQVAKTYDVWSFPTYLFFDPNGKIVHRGVGYQQKDRFIQLAKDAMDPEKQVYKLKEKYEKNKEYADIVLEYARAATDAGMSTKEVVQQYMIVSNEGEWRTPEVWQEIMHLNVPFESKLYKFAVENKDLVESLAEDDDQMQAFFSFPQRRFLMKTTRMKEEEMADAMATINEVLFGRDADAMISRMEAYWFRENRPEEGDLMMAQYLDNFCDDPDELNSEAWEVVEDSSANEQKIDKAIMWADKSIEIDKNYFNLDTKAWLHYKKGDMKEAKKLANEAIEMAESTNMDDSSSRELLAKIKEG